VRVRADDPWHAELLPELLELGCEPPFVTLDEQGRRRVPSEFGDFRGHVAYAPGDDLRFLDWRVLARTGDRMLKRFDGVEHRRLSLHVDASASVRVRGRAYLDLIELWLLLGLHTLDSIELVVHGGGGTWQGLERERFEGPADSERVRARVAGLNFDGELDPVQLGDALAQSPGGGAVLLSDFMPGEFWRGRPGARPLGRVAACSASLGGRRSSAVKPRRASCGACCGSSKRRREPRLPLAAGASSCGPSPRNSGSGSRR
jgi:hypothetical protein